ncbi:MAG: DUF368 domain-containing protein [Proteobacteria bacterium]|nr:DUF368 domain-containing protein [Pseudomonadota bacterium]MBU2455379.1 DUF368 domain-containing protein [Pseudomonadota bacterium]
MGKDIAQPSLIKELVIGFCLGTANIIPGVSGGTFLLIFNIYERVFLILNRINKENSLFFLTCILKIFFKAGKAQSLKNFITFLNKNDFIFLIKLLTGSVVAIISLSSLMKYLIVFHFSVTYALFFGLILISIIIPVKLLTEKKAYLILFFLLGAVATIYVAYAVNPYEKVKKKSEVYEDQYVKGQIIEKEKQAVKAFSFTGKYSVDEYVYASFCGAVAVSAMILPGISGSLVLILMGEYFEVVSAISGLRMLSLDNAAFLGCFSIGIILGGLFFAKLINIVLKRYYNATMAFLAGLMAGSLYTLWPFKKSIVMVQQYIKKDGVIRIAENVRVYTNINEFPQLGTQVYISLASFIIGCLIMFFFVKKEIKG